MKIKKIPLLAQIIAAIALGVVCGLFVHEWLSRVFATINSIFSNLLSFIIPLLILGLIAPGIADVGRNAGRLLAATAGVAYLFTIFSGIFSYSVCELLYPMLISGENLTAVPEGSAAATPYFSIEIPPLFGVMSALIASFMLGVGMTVIKGNALKNAMVPILPSIIGSFIGILGGSMIIEQIFSVPGVGQLFIRSITLLDYDVFMMDSIFYTTIGLLSGIIIDISYGFIDPRIRMGER